MELGILALLMGVGLMAAFAGGDSDTEIDEAPMPDVGNPNVEPPVAEAPPLINIGTDGNDTVFVRDENPTTNATLGDGDDRGYAFVTSGTFLSGGQGDDILSGITRSTLFGNAGNDQLDISSLFGEDVGQTEFDSAAYGGDGNDQLFSDRGHVEEGTVSLFGEAGQDFLHVRNEAGAIERGGITKILSGGDGDDTFRVELIFPRFDPDAPETEPYTNEDTNVFITDFAPGTELLTVLSRGVGGSLVPALDTAELTRDDEGLTTLTMTFEPIGDTPAATTTIALGYADGITLNDIVLPGDMQSGEEPFSGTTGDDRVIETRQGQVPSELLLDDGDDLANLLSEGGSVFGGDGNDTISDGGLMAGGDGNDVLSQDVNPLAAQQFTFQSMSGNGGDDILIIGAEIGGNTGEGASGMNVTGGVGADLFDVQLDMTTDTDIPATEPTQEDGLISINDFDPDHDILTVQINRDEASERRVMTSAEIAMIDVALEGENFSTFRQAIQMNFAATETAGAHTAFIRSGNAVELSIDDVVFVQN